MKKEMFKYSLLAGAMMFSGLAMANPSATLAVKGQVSTGTCTVVLPTTNIDLGNVSADRLPTTGSLDVVPAGIVFSLQLTCSSPVTYQMSITDNRADSVIPATETVNGASFEGRLLGLGKTKDNVNIGAYGINVQTVSKTIGGTDYQDILYRAAADTTWTNAATGITITPLNNAAGVSGRDYFAMGAAGSLEPESNTTAEFKIGSWFYISSALRSITDVQTIDGNMTFNIDYL